MVKLSIILIASCVSAYLYRKGGSDNSNTKWRDLGCAVVYFITAILLGIVHSMTALLLLLGSTGLLFGALTTYWKLGSEDVNWYSWFLTGLAYGVSSFPLMWAGVPLWLIIVRSILLGIATMFWSENTQNPWEELGRGFLIPLSMLLF